MENVPFSEMWPDDERWYPIMLRNWERARQERDEKRKLFDAFFLFQGFDKIIQQRIDIFEETS